MSRDVGARPAPASVARHHRRLLIISAQGIAILIVIAILAGACTSGDVETPAVPSIRRGGTLRVGFPSFPNSALTSGTGLDPQGDYFYDSWALFRCCLLRTLLSYNGRSTEEGGSEVRPDLAAVLPRVSPDGLTWTFPIKAGVHFGPPFQDREIVSGDVIRALEREGDPKIGATDAGYAFYFSPIQGFDDFTSGAADSISGLEAPDDHTLVVHVSQPTGDLANRFTLPATAPIPPRASDGHEGDFGRFLVSSGPYMLDGSEHLDFTAPPGDQRPVRGYAPRQSITLVRNPSWTSANDPLRPAYPDRIEVALGGTIEELARRVEDGSLDMQLFQGPPPQEPVDEIRTYQNDPERKTRIHVDRRDFLRYLPMNLAVPPFDDVHVRKAVNYAVDKESLLGLRGGPVAGEITGHVVLNSLENNLLVDYDPYSTPDHRGDLEKAKREMRLSAYDHDKDGVCDDPVCRDVYTPRFEPLPTVPWDKMAASVQHDLAGIGIMLDVHESADVFGEIQDPTRKVAISIGPAWGKDYINASNFFVPLFDSAQLTSDSTGNDTSLLGATPEQLKDWGYDVTSVPSVDAKIAQCQRAFGSDQFQCWAEADQLLMETVVPWVPYIEENRIVITSDRVVHYEFDQFSTMPALDQIALKLGSK
jgi:ABC-type transport system substrate-binding protein